MVYHVIGLMSGSSLDGLDIVYAELTEVRGQWSYQIHGAECIPYADKLRNSLRDAILFNARDYQLLHTAYGRFIGEQVNAFIDRHSLHHKIHFIASHGHTTFHIPEEHTTAQLGDGAAIAAVTGLPVITDLRAVDVALGGQGAPIVPIGEKLLFQTSAFCLTWAASPISPLKTGKLTVLSISAPPIVCSTHWRRHWAKCTMRTVTWLPEVLQTIRCFPLLTRSHTTRNLSRNRSRMISVPTPCCP